MMDTFTSVHLQTVLPGELEAVLSNLDRLEEAISLLNVSKEPSGEVWQEAKHSSSECEKCSAKPDPKTSTETTQSSSATRFACFFYNFPPLHV